MNELRPYQQDLLKRVQSALQNTDKPVMMQLPTGGGKTVIAAALLADYLVERRKAVWLTHRKELASQTEEMLFEYGVSATCDVKWRPGTKAPRIANGTVILMAQTVGRRTKKGKHSVAGGVWNNYNENDLMIVDEAHHAVAKGWERAIRQWPGKVVGMTATPWRLSKKEGFDHLFGDLILGPQVSELQGNEFLCEAELLWPDEGDRIRGGKVSPNTHDYTPNGIEAANANREVMTTRALSFWLENANNRQTIIYAVSVGHAEKLAILFRDERITAETIHTETDTETRGQSVSRFANGKLKALINVDIVTEGFDLPDASCIVMARPTKSLSLYLQMIGRGLRPKPDGGNCLILDLAWNHVEHGFPEDHREWFLEAQGNSDGGGAPKVRCKKCEKDSPAASHKCNSCGALFGKKCLQCAEPRAFRTAWLLEDLCGSIHELVCDRCHIDLHGGIGLQFEIPFQENSRERLCFESKFVYQDHRIVARALLTALLHLGSEEQSNKVIQNVKEILHEQNRRFWGLSGELIDKPLREGKELYLSIIYQRDSLIINRDVEYVYDQLKKSGFCIAKPYSKRWRLTKKFVHLVKQCNSI